MLVFAEFFRTPGDRGAGPTKEARQQVQTRLLNIAGQVRRELSAGLPVLWLVLAGLLSVVVWSSIDRETEPPVATAAADNPPGPWTVIGTELPDFAGIEDVSARKRAFFDFMRPIIKTENSRVFSERIRLQAMREYYEQHGSLSPRDRAWLTELAGRYEFEGFVLEHPSAWQDLLSRVDIVPTELALVQAANESAWGTSRFARLGNGIFGQWSYQKGSGIVPRRRADGASHEVASFATVNEAVSSYLHNLNTNLAYLKFRRLRSGMRSKGNPLEAYTLADGLLRYSERREDYVEDLRAMIRVNRHLLGPA